jgi:hypothetical protein
MEWGSAIGAFLATGIILGVFLTMPAGQALARRLGLDGLVRGAPSTGDREFLLRVCSGDRAEVERRLAVERARFPDITDEQIHRRAIRTYMNNRPESAE